jgi:1-acyl-sn-glycerol-3-phosphate acyltransferase
MDFLRVLLIVTVFRPLARLLTGADVIGREHLPLRGPAIVTPNHNSHVDTLLLLCIFRARALRFVRPVAAADYFLADPVIAWFSRHVIGIVPVWRNLHGEGADLLAPMRAALDAGAILVMFPEGTRGRGQDDMAPFKSGVARLAEAYPDAPVTPVWIQGAGRVLPKGEALPVPLTCQVQVGAPLRFAGDRAQFLDRLRCELETLRAQAPPLRWRTVSAARPPANPRSRHCDRRTFDRFAPRSLDHRPCGLRRARHGRLGGWAAFVNRHAPFAGAAAATLTQAALSGAITTGLKQSLERLSARLTGRSAFVVPPSLTCVATLALLIGAHTLAGTPDLWRTIALPWVVSSTYAWLYSLDLRRRRGFDTEVPA